MNRETVILSDHRSAPDFVRAFSEPRKIATHKISTRSNNEKAMFFPLEFGKPFST